jgi:hypothetical protein
MAAGFKNKHRVEFKDVGVVLDETVNDWATSVPSVPCRMIDPKTLTVLTNMARVSFLSPRNIVSSSQNVCQAGGKI